MRSEFLMKKMIAALALLLGLSGCGDINFPGCDPTGSNKTYRGIGCSRICKAAYSHCTNGNNADPDNDCQCTKPVSGGTGGGGGSTVVPNPIAASCVCYYTGSPDYVNLHLAGSCPAWLNNLTPGQLRTGIGRPIGSGQDSSCTNICQSGGGQELRGVFQFEARGKGVCTPDATMFPGTILGDYVSGGQLAESAPGDIPEALARAEFRMQRVDFRLAQAGLLQPLAQAGAPAAPAQFKMREIGIECRAECAMNGEFCAEFKVDSANTRGIVETLARLPGSGEAKTINLAELRGAAFSRSMTNCTHASVAFAPNGQLRSDGARCDQPLYLSFAGVQDFSAAVSVPQSVKAVLTSAGGVRQMVFSEEAAMISLQLKPVTLHRLYGGRVRAAASDGERLTLETQNSCIAIKLKP